jgi:hypothetical protein
LRKRETSRRPKRWNLEGFPRRTNETVLLLLAMIPTINHRRVPREMGKASIALCVTHGKEDHFIHSSHSADICRFKDEYEGKLTSRKARPQNSNT